jgi:hypothetical protein
MDNTQLIVIVLGALGLMGLAVLAYLGKKSAEAGQVIAPLFREFVTRLDTLAAGYGSQLAPVHEIVSGVGLLFDEDTDTLVKAINSPRVIAAIRASLKELEQLTDGEIQEAIPQPEQSAPEVKP